MYIQAASNSHKINSRRYRRNKTRWIRWHRDWLNSMVSSNETEGNWRQEIHLGASFPVVTSAAAGLRCCRVHLITCLLWELLVSSFWHVAAWQGRNTIGYYRQQSILSEFLLAWPFSQETCQYVEANNTPSWLYRSCNPPVVFTLGIRSLSSGSKMKHPHWRSKIMISF